jgi:hypothetical protein
MRYLYIYLLICLFAIKTSAQTCDNCKTVYENYTGTVHVKNNEQVCLKGTFSGSIELSGGALNICGQANITSVNFKQPSSFKIAEGASVFIKTINSNKEVNLINYCDSFVIGGGGFNQPFTLTNYGKAYIQGGSFNSTFTVNNTDTLIINTNLNLSGKATFTNTGYLLINGNLNPNNASVVFQNQCQLRINGDMTLNGQTVNVGGGYLRINNVNINSGKIVLSESSVFYVNQINVNGTIEGTGSRSTMVCTQNPNLNSQPSIKGNISLCVKTGNFNPNPGRIEAPATVDCNNPIPGSKCNPEPYGIAYFRMVPQQSSSWNSSSTWEIQTSTGWVAAPSGRYPTSGCAVLIGDGKQMTATQNVTISKLVLGESTSGGRLILDPTKSVLFNVEDTTQLTAQSQIELNNSTLLINGLLVGDVNVKGGSFGNLALNVKNPTATLRFDQSVPGVSNKVSILSYNMSNSGTVSLSDTLHIGFALNPQGGTLQTNDKLILDSYVSGTACVAPGNGNYIQGKVTVNKFIPAVARRYRFVSSPVSDGNLLDWQQEVYITGNNAAGNATGTTVGQLNSAGFDATSSNAPSMYWYDETATGNLNNGWMAVTNETNTLADYPLQVGRGYRLFIRGDRSDLGRLDGSLNDQNAVTLNIKGTLNTGDVSVPVLFNDFGATLWDNGWNQIGNPYAASIDWEMMYNDNALHSNIEPIVWTYDPAKNTYISYNALTGSGTLQSGLIAGGQSFWVKADGPAAPIVFKEKYKTIKTTFSLAREEDNRDDEIKITLIKDSINQDQSILKYVPGAQKAKDPYDILKYWGGSVGVAFYNPEDTSYLELSARPVNYVDADMMKLYFYVDASGQYEFKFNKTSNRLFNSVAKLYLFDNFTNQYINILNGQGYSFTVDMNDNASKDNFRFSLIFFPSSPPVADVNYFFATPSDTSTVLLEWGSLMEPIPTTYRVQRGLSTAIFSTLGTVVGTGSEVNASDYEFLDTTVNGYTELFYRISYSDTITTSAMYTPIIRINLLTGEREIMESKASVKLYPNPVANVLTIQSEQLKLEQTEVRIIDITGKEWLSFYCGQQTDGSLELDCSQLPKGLYVVHLKSNNGVATHHKILKQ